MEVIKTEIEGVVIIEPRLFKDERGYFFESFSQRDFDKQVRTIHFVQDNESKSSYGVLRGLHFQKPPFAQSKLVRVIRYTERFSDIRTARSRKTDRRQPPPVFHSARICSRIQRIE